MSTVASRDLRNHTAEVLRKVADGDAVVVTVNGRAVAEIGPVRTARPRALRKADLVEILLDRQSDAALTADLERLAPDTTDDLDPL